MARRRSVYVLPPRRVGSARFAHSHDHLPLPCILLQKHVGGVRIITAAPELEGIIGSVALLSERGVIFSIGHR